MSFNGTEGGEISLAKASEMTSNYRSQNPGETIAHFFGKDIIQRILSQEGCMGIRIYYGIDQDETKQLILVGADENQNDIIQLVADLSFPCPQTCSTHNPLNS